MDKYNELMKRCIELAKKGRGNVSPNPLVGCVVLNKSGELISEGYHHKYGENHAERDALLKINNGEETDGTLIVNLEPCSHQGKTPPCADLIIERGIKTVVIGCKDNNPKVNGGGIKKLKEAGIEVIEGILEEDCKNLNEIFFTDIERHRTFVAIKTATTIDGKIATINGDSKWITSEKSRQYAKDLRSYYDAILTSSSTVISDNPTMEHKLKIILDRNLTTDLSSTIYESGNIILVVDKENQVNPDDFPKNVKILYCSVKENKFDLQELMKELYSLKIKSIFIEAGGKLLGNFVKAGLVDKIYHFISPKILNDNSGKSCFDGDKIFKISDSKIFLLEDVKKTDTDALLIYKKRQI